MFGHHRSGCIGDKIVVRQLLPHSEQLGFDFGDFFAEPLAFGLEIDQALKRKKELTERSQRGRSAFRRLVVGKKIEPFRVEQNAQNIGFIIAQRA